MVRRGSTVRVRQRALERPANGLLCCLEVIRPALDLSPNRVPNSRARAPFGLYRGLADHRAPPCYGGGRQSRDGKRDEAPATTRTRQHWIGSCLALQFATGSCGCRARCAPTDPAWDPPPRREGPPSEALPWLPCACGATRSE